LPDGYPERVLRRQLINAFLYMNTHYSVEPLSKDEVIRIFNANYKKYKTDGYLDVEKYKVNTRFVFWHSDCQIPSTERLSRGNTLLLNARGKGKEYNEQLIYNAIESIQDGKTITKQRLVEATGLSPKAVQRYSKGFKSLIDNYNESILQSSVYDLLPFN